MTLFEWAVRIKTKIANRLSEINAALVDKGQTEAASLKEVPAKITAITTKTDMSDANATGAKLLSGYRAYNNDGPFDGEIPVYATTSADPVNTNDGGVKVTFPAGYYEKEHGGEIPKAGGVGLTVTVSPNGVVTASGKHSSPGYATISDTIEGTANLTVEEWTITYTSGSPTTKKVVIM